MFAGVESFALSRFSEETGSEDLIVLTGFQSITGLVFRAGAEITPPPPPPNDGGVPGSVGGTTTGGGVVPVIAPSIVIAELKLEAAEINLSGESLIATAVNRYVVPESRPVIVQVPFLPTISQVEPPLLAETM